MADYNQELTESAVSRLNSGGLINLRLHNLWVDRHKFAQKGNYTAWNEILDAIWCELGSDVPENSPEDKQYWALTLEYAKACETVEKPKGFEPASGTQKTAQVNKKVALIKKELFLRRLQNKQGKGTAYIEEDDFD